jgi:hypothetical protein
VTPHLEARIRALASPAHPTEPQLAELLAGWDRLFVALGLSEAQQDAEFDGIIRARVQSGIVSLVAPRRLTEA